MSSSAARTGASAREMGALVCPARTCVEEIAHHVTRSSVSVGSVAEVAKEMAVSVS